MDVDFKKDRKEGHGKSFKIGEMRIDLKISILPSAKQ